MAGSKGIFVWPVGLRQGLLLRCLLLISFQCVASVVWHTAQQTNSTVISERSDAKVSYLGNNGTSQPVCNLTVNDFDSGEFLRRLLSKQANFAYLHLKFPQNVSVKVRDDVFLPFIWIWTTTTPHGAYPYLQFDHDAGKISFGLLDFYTLRNVTIRFQAKPQNCSLELGEPHTTNAIGAALGNMTVKHIHAIHGRNYSVFCRIVKLDPDAINKVLFDFTTYLGYWKDLTGYSCCSFYRAKISYKLRLTCRESAIRVSDWTTFFYFIAVICFMYLPIPLTMLCDCLLERTKNTDSTDDPEVLASINISTSDETPLLRGTRIGDHLSEMDSTQDDWFYLSLDKPVTLISLIRTPFKRIGKKFPLFTSKLIRFSLFAMIIPLPVYVRVVYYRLAFLFSTTERMKAGIPVGFLSVPFGVYDSAANWLTIFGGPIVVLGLYLTIGQICICTPGNMSSFFMSVFRREGGCKSTLLSMDLSAIERFGAVEINNKTVLSASRHLFQGNLFTLLNPSFWIFAFRFWCDRFRRSLRSEAHFSVVTCISVFFYVILCVVEVALCIVYYGFPTVFYCVNFTRAYLYHYSSSDKHRFWWYPLIILSLLFTYYSFFLIFIRGALFILLVIDYTYIGVIVYPTLALGYIIAMGTMLLYLGRSSQQLVDSYLAILHEIVKINLALHNTYTQSRLAISGDVLSLKHVSPGAVRSLEIGGISIPLTKEQREMLKLAQSDLNSRVPSKKHSKYIRWHGPCPGIPRELFFYVVEKQRPLRRAVFVFLVELSAFTVVVTSVVKLIIAFNRVSSFTLAAQVVTALVLTILPKLSEFFTTQMERIIQREVMTNKIKILVDNFYSENENAFKEQNRRYLIPVV